MKNFGFVRVGAGVPEVRIGDPKRNGEKISLLMDAAKKEDVQIIVFPELSITSYTCGDLFYQNALLEGALNALESILIKTKNNPILGILGMPLVFQGSLYNCGVVIQKGEILGVIPKTYIPNHNEFYEKRWFSSGVSIKGEKIILLGKEVPFGVDLLLEDPTHTGSLFGVELCEDLWVPITPGSLLSKAGALMIFNLSASNELVGKGDYRRNLIVNESARCITAYTYSSCGAGESTTDLVFGGYALVSEYGTILGERKSFTKDRDFIFADIDTEKLLSLRKKNPFYAEQSLYFYRKIAYHLESHSNPKLHRPIDPHPFVPQNQDTKHQRCEEIFSIQREGLYQRLHSMGCKKAVIGISGGLDSTLALLVTGKTFDQLGISRENIIGVTMPGFGTTEVTYKNAVELIGVLGASLREVDIKRACNIHFEDIGQDKNRYDIAFENAQARERTQILMDIANQEGGIVIGTGDLSELALGWCTYNGDQMSMYGVNAGVPKTLVRHLVEWECNNMEVSEGKSVLRRILKTPISPELIPPDKDGEITQKTEDILGDYELHDFFIYNLLRWGYTPQKILYLAKFAFEGKYEYKELKRVLGIFIKRFFTQQFKRSAMPDGPKVGTVSLSPRGDLRMPSDAAFALWLQDIGDEM
jgi:NAD+ synthase (glutamine-hydrolysing)